MILVLDFDGVVQTGHAEGGRWDKHLLRDLGIAPHALQEFFFKPFWRGLLVGDGDLYEVLSKMWQKLACEATPRAFIEYWFSKDWTLNRELLDAVARLRVVGHSVSLATNQEHHRARYLWDVRRLSNHFDAMNYSAALGAMKPELAFFDRARERLPVTAAHQIVFLDDSQEYVDGASVAGWNARLYRGIEDLNATIAEMAG